MKLEWLRAKAAYYAAAWQRRFGFVPTIHNVALGCSVAAHETVCGDAWRGPDGLVGTFDDERNWGACTLRSLSAAEKAAIAKAGILPTVGKGHEDRARAAMKALADAGLLPVTAEKFGIKITGTLHCDSYTDAGGLRPYFTFFGNFKDHTDGADYFICLLAGAQRQKTAAQILENDAGSEYGLAAAMYGAGYYRGFFDRDRVYEDGKTGRDKNIEAYAGRIRAFRPQFTNALVGEAWPPPIPAKPPLLSSVELFDIDALMRSTAADMYEEARAFSIADRDAAIAEDDS